MISPAWLTNLPDLTVINEDAQLDNGPVDDSDDVNDDGDLQANGYFDRRRASVGAMSGTTAKTSFSQEEIAELDTDVMVDVLSDLLHASEQMAELLVPDKLEKRPIVRKDVRIEGAKYNKMYINRLKAIRTHNESFGSTEYIQPNIVLRALLGVTSIKELPEAPWRPDNLFYKINLTQMLCTLLAIVPGNTDVSEPGYRAMNNLGVHFCSGIAGPIFQPNAFQMCLSIVTQLAIIKMSAWVDDYNFNPQQYIEDTFYARDMRGGTCFKHETVLHMDQIPEEEREDYIATCHRRAEQLESVFDEHDRASWKQSLAMLRIQFDWNEFVEEVYQYSRERTDQLNSEIMMAGGTKEIVHGLAKEVERRADAKIAEQKRQSFSRSSGTPKKGFGKKGIKALKAREKSLAASTAQPAPSAPVAQMTQPAAAMRDETAPTEQIEEPAFDLPDDTIADDLEQPAPDVPDPTAPPPLDDWVHHDDDDILEPEPPVETEAQAKAKSVLSVLSGVQKKQQQNAEKGKKRSFIDRQPGATRISFDDSQPTTQYEVPGYAQASSQNGPYYQDPQRGSSKRPHADLEEEGEEEDFDPTQDEGFQNDTRDTAAADRRRRELPPPREPQPRFSSIEAGIPGSAPITVTASPRKRARKNPGSTIPSSRPYNPDENDDGPHLQQARRLALARNLARHNTVMSTQNRPQQVRIPWSPVEEDALIDLIQQEGEQGLSYASLKSIDQDREEPLLARRTAEDLRFKARNMKETFLK